jgi:hypothetical protein
MKGEKGMISNGMGNLTRNRKFYLLLCGVMVFTLFVAIPAAKSAQNKPSGITVLTFAGIDFVDPKCWTLQTLSANSAHIEYTNTCTGSSSVILTHVDGTEETFLVAPSGRLIFLGGNVVHIIKGDAQAQ